MQVPGEKLLIKLWETLAEKGVGSLLKPWHTIRQGQAEAEVRRHELLMLVQVEKDAEDIRAGRKIYLNTASGVKLLSSLSDGDGGAQVSRIEPSLSFESAAIKADSVRASFAVQEEVNCCKAVLYAEERLRSDKAEAPLESVEDDWLYAWRLNAGKVTSEDMQKLWGSVLAGEIKAPGKYSLRTMDFLSKLSRVDAERITKLAPFVIGDIISSEHSDYLSAKGVKYSFLLQMQELGLLIGVESLTIRKNFSSAFKDGFARVLVSNGKCLLVEHSKVDADLSIPAYRLTSVGCEVLSIGSFEPDLDYLRLVGERLVKEGFTVHICDWVEEDEGQGSCDNLVPVYPSS